MNNHDYDEYDFSNFKDPLEKEEIGHCRIIRGGLALQADFRTSLIDPEYETINRDFDENELLFNPLYDDIMRRMQNKEQTLEAFIEKMKCSELICVKNVKLVPTSDKSLFYIHIPELQFDPELFSPGIHVDIKSTAEDKLRATSFCDFDERRDQELPSLQFNESDGFNLIQKQAVYSILNRSHFPYPFLLFGPPGTGKTVTLIESIRQIVLQSKNNRVLVCTPSKTAADNFAEHLLSRKLFHPKYIFRMHSLSTSALGRSNTLDSICYLPKEGRQRFFGIPDRKNLQMFRIIICTLSTSSYLISAGGLRGFFSHIFIDEAGQATEPDSWIPIGGLLSNNTSVILAGDPNQLGPVINMKLKNIFGDCTSMLKRLMFSETYENADEPCSYLFYDNMLRANEEDEILYKLCEWEGLPTKGFPIIFRSSLGSEEVQSINKSFHNDIELEIVMDYVKRILEQTDTKAKDIGIISPYKNQARKFIYKTFLGYKIT